MKQRYILLSILVITFFVFSADRHAQLRNDMYPKKALAVELSEPEIISLSARELLYHHSMAITLMYEHGIPNLLEKVQMLDMHESYARTLHKIDAIIETESDPYKIVTYYVYVFMNKDTVTKILTMQSLHVVCLWEDDKVILNCGFKKDCTADNNWLYWKNENCPSIQELERELKKAFNFEQIEIKRKTKRKEGINALFFIFILLKNFN